jgi:UDP-N-acetylmuramyl tripeptide synthase
MQLIDARRLTGPNLLSPRPLVVAEIALEPGESLPQAIATWERELVRMRQALAWPEPVAPRLHVRPHLGGALLGFAEPIDTMLAAAELTEWAALSAVELLAGRPALPLEPKRAEIAAMRALQVSPALLGLEREALARHLPLLWDDESVSVGSGHTARVWPRNDLPDPSSVPWDTIGRIPTALVTGTNGKTTSARLLARVAREAGKTAGTTSTEGIYVGGALVEDGDMTGPAAARTVLRRADVEVAVLETARGGIMRRGLAMEDVDAALLTNVSSDHLGDYGIDTVAQMAEAKAVIGKVVRPSGRVVLNALDPHLMALKGSFLAPVVLFSSRAGNKHVEQHCAAGGVAYVLSGRQLCRKTQGGEELLLSVDEVPLTFGGAALYNVENVLGVMAMAAALGLPDEAMKSALRGFHSTEDNPGRGNLYRVGDVRVLLDFGHNPEGVRRVLELVRALLHREPGRLFVVTGGPGDRSDDDFAQVANQIQRAGASQVFLRDLDGYLRGRQPGEVPALFQRELLARGLEPSQVSIVSGEVEALTRALDGAQPGDFVALLVHIEHDAVHAFLRARGAVVQA